MEQIYSNIGKKGIFFILCLTLLFTYCTPPKDHMATDLAAFVLMGDTAKVVNWRLIKRYDPYNGGQSYHFEPEQSKQLLLSSNGTFTEREGDYIQKGKWYLKNDKSAIAFYYLERNGQKLPKEEASQSKIYLIKKLSRDTMVLSWQGRHGMVEDYYIADSPSNKRLPLSPLSL